MRSYPQGIAPWSAKVFHAPRHGFRPARTDRVQDDAGVAAQSSVVVPTYPQGIALLTSMEGCASDWGDQLLRNSSRSRLMCCMATSGGATLGLGGGGDCTAGAAALACAAQALNSPWMARWMMPNR